MRIPLLSSIVLLLTLPACNVWSVGPTAETFTPALSGGGVEATLQIPGEVLRGELLEVGEASLLVLHGREIVEVPFRSVRRGEFRDVGTRIGGGRTPPPAAHERLRLVSRFPHGLTDEARVRLLSAYGQAAPRVVP
jgi:hypothetical protein